MTPDKIIEKGDEILLDASGIDKRMYKRLMAYLANHTLGGKVSITNEDLAQLEDIIYSEIKDSDYEENIANYLKLFTALEDAISKQQAEINDFRVSAIRDLWRGNELRTILLDRIVYDLGRGGISQYFVKGLAEVVRDASFYNLTISDAADKLSEVLLKNNYTKQYVNNVARDALSQYEGAINQAVKEAYDLTAWRYIGNTIETSRPVCAHIMNKFKGRFTDNDLTIILNEFCPDGKPSQVTTEYETQNGVIRKAKKGSGMIEGTRPANFAQLRGGHGCRHTCIPVSK